MYSKLAIYAVQTEINLFEASPPHTQVGVEEQLLLAFDIQQAWLDRTGQFGFISFPLLLLYIYCTESMS